MSLYGGTGTVAEWLERSATGVEGPRVKGTAWAQGLSIAPSVHPAVNGYLTLFRSKKGEGMRKRSGSPPSLPRCWYKFAL